MESGVLLFLQSGHPLDYRLRLSLHIPHRSMHQSLRKVEHQILILGQIVGYLAVALTFTTSAANQLIYSVAGASEAAAAGFILLSIVYVSGYSIQAIEITLTCLDCLDLLLRL